MHISATGKSARCLSLSLSFSPLNAMLLWRSLQPLEIWRDIQKIVFSKEDGKTHETRSFLLPITVFVWDFYCSGNRVEIAILRGGILLN